MPETRVCPSTSQRFRPCAVNIIPSVASSGGMFRNTISTALIEPAIRPVSRQTRIAVPPVNAYLIITSAATVTDRPTMPPTDRSRSPTIAVSVMPSAAIPATVCACSTEVRVFIETKLSIVKREDDQHDEEDHQHAVAHEEVERAGRRPVPSDRGAGWVLRS